MRPLSVRLKSCTKLWPSVALGGPLITADSRRDADANDTSAMNNTPELAVSA